MDKERINTPPYRVGRNQKRVVLDSRGYEVVMFSIGQELFAQDYCDYLNTRNLEVNQSRIVYDKIRSDWDKRSDYLQKEKSVDTEEIFKMFYPYLNLIGSENLKYTKEQLINSFDKGVETVKVNTVEMYGKNEESIRREREDYFNIFYGIEI